MRFAYADPPYLGQCRLYGHEHNDVGYRPFDGRCWDDLATHAALCDWLHAEFPDGWAMSASSPSLRHIWPLTADDTRVGVWTKKFCAFKRGVRPAYAWEPVIYRSHRNPPHQKHAPPERGGKQTTPKDFVSCSITLEKGFTGAKPPEFCWWVISLLNVQPDEDALVDVFPGTGAMTRAWSGWSRGCQTAIDLPDPETA